MPSLMMPKSARKLKRRLENDAQAKEARFWKSKTIFAAAGDGRIFSPANKQAADISHGDDFKYKSGKQVTVYLYRVKTKGHDETFLKIGLTGAMDRRFGPDKVRYKFWLVGSVGGLKRKEAIAIEQNLHAMFANKSYRPKFGFVSGGHTECFVDDEFIVATALQAFALIEKEKANLGRQHVTDHCAASADPYVVSAELIEHHAKIDKIPSEKMRSSVADFDARINAAVAARRARYRKRPPKPPQNKLA